jgi:hypothetical protein
MFKKLLLTFGLVLSFSAYIFSQTATIQGVITDQETGEPIPFANIVAERGGTQVGGATTDFDGRYVHPAHRAGPLRHQSHLRGLSAAAHAERGCFC